ncbi:unnamed protein product, partial [Pylaiella littoralis]
MCTPSRSETITIFCSCVCVYSLLCAYLWTIISRVLERCVHVLHSFAKRKMTLGRRQKCASSAPFGNRDWRTPQGSTYFQWNAFPDSVFVLLHHPSPCPFYPLWISPSSSFSCIV